MEPGNLSLNPASCELANGCFCLCLATRKSRRRDLVILRNALRQIETTYVIATIRGQHFRKAIRPPDDFWQDPRLQAVEDCRNVQDGVQSSGTSKPLNQKP